MADRLQEARDRWRTEQHMYAAYGALIEGRIKAQLASAGIYGQVSSRAKDTDSLVKKLIRKPDHTYESLGDKAGIRVIVHHRDDAAQVLRIVQTCFECRDLEDTADRLGTVKVGYRGWHVSVLLNATDPNWIDFRGIEGELQVRTQAQHLWSEMAHDAIYKNEADVPPDLVRRMHLLAGLIEVADDEFLRIGREIADVPGMGAVLVLRELERLYIKFVGRDWDRELSLDVVQHLLPLYSPNKPADVARILADFSTSEAELINTVVEREQKTDLERSVFVLQPEMLMIYERLKKDLYNLRDRWAIRYPEQELERFAVAFGMTI